MRRRALQDINPNVQPRALPEQASLRLPAALAEATTFAVPLPTCYNPGGCGVQG